MKNNLKGFIYFAKISVKKELTIFSTKYDNFTHNMNIIFISSNYYFSCMGLSASKDTYFLHILMLSPYYFYSIQCTDISSLQQTNKSK